ncbi:MAG: hypothetical protein KAI43_05355 [Candidatus Aureabacteria bacterium]|nr:hypothetical protein [Candidatus Auribacterota bacterium]
MLDKLKKLKASKELANVYRKVPEEAGGVSYYILDCSKELILGHYVDEFHLNGYAIFRLKDIKKIRCSKNDRYRNKILKKEGIWQKVGIDYSIDLSSWKTVLKILKKQGKNIQILGEEPEVDEFVIGKITKVNEKSVKVLYFDATGKWEKEPRVIPYSEITLILFEDEYVNIYSKYTR